MKIVVRTPAEGEIAACAVLAPLTHVSDTLFLGEFANGIKVSETTTGDG